MRVVALINGLVPDGAERSLSELLPRLRERDIEVEVICLDRHEGNIDQRLRAAGFNVMYLRAGSSVGRIMELRRLFRVRAPDLIHTTIIESDILGRIAGFGTQIPVVTSIVNTSYDRARFSDGNIVGWKLRLIQAVDGFTARHMASGFHALTAAVAEAVEETLGIDKNSITVIGRSREADRLGRKTAERRLDVRRSLGLDESHDVVLATGRQDYQKGHITLIEATARLLPSRPNLRVLLAGRDGSESRKIHRRITDLDLSSKLLSLGYREDVPDLLAAADVFAFPSLYEGFGGSLLEAMALGVPAIASDLPVLREVGGRCVQYAPRGDADSWARAIADLLDDIARRDTLAQCAQRRVRRQFNAARIADAYAAWYRRMVVMET